MKAHQREKVDVPTGMTESLDLEANPMGVTWQSASRAGWPNAWKPWLE